MEQSLEHRVEVTGTATRDTEPDRAGWVLRIVEADQEEQLAFDRCAVRASAVTEALEREFGEDAEVTSRGVRFAEQWDRKGRGRPEAVAEVRVVTAVARAGEAARVAMDAGANRVDGPHFVVSDAATQREELLADAVQVARRKAERAAAAADRRLGRAVLIQERGDRDHEVAFAVGARLDDAEPRVDPAAQTLSASVRVTFELDE